MTGPLPASLYPKAPAHVAPDVAVLGPELALDFLLRFGGAPQRKP